MPFDAMPAITESEAATALRLIDAVIEALGPNGERWRKGDLTSPDGKHCIMGALHYCRRKLRTPRGDRTTFFLRRAINHDLPFFHYAVSVMQFNDLKCDGFADVRKILLLARELAVCAAEGRPEPPCKRRRQ